MCFLQSVEYKELQTKKNMLGFHASLALILFSTTTILSKNRQQESVFHQCKQLIN